MEKRRQQGMRETGLYQIAVPMNSSDPGLPFSMHVVPVQESGKHYQQSVTLIFCK